jgi:hypothetical protein
MKGVQSSSLGDRLSEEQRRGQKNLNDMLLNIDQHQVKLNIIFLNVVVQTLNDMNIEQQQLVLNINQVYRLTFH